MEKDSIKHTYFLQPHKTPLPINPAKYVIIDTDPGNDDIHAIFITDYLKTKFNFEVLGITCVSGNTTVQNCSKNAALALSYCKFKSPIYLGSSCPVIQDVHRDNFFEPDGIGGVSKKYYPTLDESLIQKGQNAIDFLINSCKEKPKQVDIWTIGPLTNIARCIIQDPDFPNYVGNIISMGGSYLGVGNMFNYVSEFNFGGDVEACYLVAKRILKWVLVPYQPVMEFIIDDELQKQMFEPDTQKGRLIKEIYTAILPKCNNQYSICDPLIPLVGIDPSVIKEWYYVHGEIENQGMCRGSLKLDWINLLEKEKNHNMIICAKFDIPKVTKYAEEALLD